jgi:hypothetical protein
VSPPSSTAILIPSPLQWSPLVVGREKRSGLCFINKESLVKSAPYPPVARITTPYSVWVFPFLSVYSTPVTSPVYSFLSNFYTLDLANNLALWGEAEQIVSNFSISPYVIVIPGNLSFPLWVLA